MKEAKTPKFNRVNASTYPQTEARAAALQPRRRPRVCDSCSKFRATAMVLSAPPAVVPNYSDGRTASQSEGNELRHGRV